MFGISLPQTNIWKHTKLTLVAIHVKIKIFQKTPKHILLCYLLGKTDIKSY